MLATCVCRLLQRPRRVVLRLLLRFELLAVLLLRESLGVASDHLRERRVESRGALADREGWAGAATRVGRVTRSDERRGTSEAETGISAKSAANLVTGG